MRQGAPGPQPEPQRCISLLGAGSISSLTRLNIPAGHPNVTHLVGHLPCIVLDGELGQWHFRLRVQWVCPVVVVTLLEERVVSGLGRDTAVTQGLGIQQQVGTD